MRTIHRLLLLVLFNSCWLASTAGLAGTFTANFNGNVLPPGASIEGMAVLEDSTLGGVTNAVVKITKAVGSQIGAFIIEDVDAGAPVNGFDLKLKLRVGGGSSPPADGYSFSFGSNVTGAFSEEGTGEGLTIAFDTYDNGALEAPAVDLKWNGQTLASTKVPISRIRSGNLWWDLNIHLDSDGSVDVIISTNQIYKDFIITGFTAIGGIRYGIGARTGGATDNHWIDDVTLATTVGPVKLAFAQQPADTIALEGRKVALRSVVNDAASVTSYQWQRKAPGAADFTDIAGATSETYLVDATKVTDTGTQFRVTAKGQNNNATSSVATLTVITIPVPAPNLVLDFNNAQVPPKTSLLGVAQVTADGGVANSGVLRLTDAVNDQAGAFVISDFNDGKNVESLVATFKVRIGGGSTPPADGLSFSWAVTSPTVAPVTAEDGFGGGLRLGFDIYDNGGGEAPAIELRQSSRILASRKFTVEQIETGEEFADVLVRLERDGTVDVAFKGEVLFHNIVYPNWTSLANGRFIFAARTGGLNENQFIDDVAISTTLQATNPTLAFARESGDLVLTFTGVLQSADRVEGPYVDVNGASNPLRTRLEAGPKFYRARSL
jgi:hypothetical protein